MAKKHFKCIVLALAILLSLAGCAKLDTINEIRSKLKRELGESTVIVSYVNGITDSGYSKNTYDIKYLDLEFNLVNFMYKDILFGFDAAGYSSNYTTQLYELFSEDIRNVSTKYNVNIAEPKYENDKCIVIRNNACDFGQLSSGVYALKELKTLVNDYLPKQRAGVTEFELQLLSFTDYDVWPVYVEDRSDLDYDYIDKLLKLEVAQSIRDSDTVTFECTKEELNNIPIKRLDNLYIDGELIESDRYPIEFYYDIKRSKYYTIMCFGTKLDYNNGVEDYLQREIIEKMYPYSNYKINERKNETTYTIFNNIYKVIRRENVLKAYKNSSELEIETINELNGSIPNASYFTWVSIDSFAELMSMKVEKVTDTGIYLSTVYGVDYKGLD